MTGTIAPIQTDAAATGAGPTVADQAPIVLDLAAGYVGFRVVAMGLRRGLIAALADRPATADELADRLDLDEFYVGVWCRAALAARICDRVGERYALAPHLDTLLLDTGSPAFAGGVFDVLAQPEVFDRFEATLPSGERMWWDDTSQDWIGGVAGTGRPFYTRLVPAGLTRVPGLAARLDAGCLVVDTACGSGLGLVRLAEHYPACEFIGVDGDAYSLEQAQRQIEAARIADRVTLSHQPLEEFVLERPATVVINNISMHECSDIDAVAARVHAALEPGGWFVISDFPFPETTEGLRTVPGRIMAGIQFFEAQIDDQLLPRTTYDDLLRRHGFRDLGSFELTPMHAVTHARR